MNKFRALRTTVGRKPDIAMDQRYVRSVSVNVKQPQVDACLEISADLRVV